MAAVYGIALVTLWILLDQQFSPFEMKFETAPMIAVLTALVIIGLVDVFCICFLLSNFVIIKVLKLKEVVDQSKWFWMTFPFFLMTFVTFVTDFMVWNQDTVYYSISSTADIIKAFSAVNVFIIFCLRIDVYEAIFSSNYHQNVTLVIEEDKKQALKAEFA